MKPTGPIPILWAAFGAAVGSTVVELLLWWIVGDDAIHNLLRDARLTAAIAMGRRALGSSTGFDPVIMGVATLVHAALSLAYAAVLAKTIRGLSPGPALVVGGVFGLVLYGVNLYGFTAIFPWFVQVRGGITLIAHLVFGIMAAAVYRIVRRAPRA
ncbi:MULTISPECIES: sodium:proline symporter [Burkholderia]|uniref:Sodium:proline symporter n=1 Tax=Burkholderia anthina TaxID=179879 RepID=A0ABS2AZS5_9BURK|nr:MULTISPECIES: sodium:proline symporter [Burkholderia]AXK67302.1 sodium:proline symporter [Burkholderia sp. IDO3]MBM2766240.1 sodium:proline symporter [Burkholderia anthina]PCD57345.1 sodium:proline symporter [Burkholderia sp. IDO3]